MNFVEQCRKGAGWPSLHRDVPQKKDGQKSWSISQEELAAFVGQVRSRSDDMVAELRSKDDRIAKLSDEKAAMAKENAVLSAKLLAYEFTKKVTRKSEALGLDHAQTKELAGVVS